MPGQPIALGLMGSLSHGTYIPDHIDDVDIMGIYCPRPEDLVGLGRHEHSVWAQDELDIVAYSLGKMVGLLLKANPNVLGFLWLPEYVYTTPAFDRLLAMRDAFSSREAYHTFSGYAWSQYNKMENGVYRGYMGEKRKELVREFGYDVKNGAHLIRLLRMGNEFLRTGQLNVRRSDAAELLAIKQGGWSLAQVRQEAHRLMDDARLAVSESPLPAKPDRKRAEAFLVETQTAYLMIATGMVELVNR